MFRSGEDADEPAEITSWNRALRVLRFKFGDRWLLTDDELQFGDEIDHQSTVRAQRLQQGVAPTAKLRVALAKKRSHQALKGLRQRRIGDVTFVLVELARGEQAARRNEHLVQFD